MPTCVRGRVASVSLVSGVALCVAAGGSAWADGPDLEEAFKVFPIESDVESDVVNTIELYNFAGRKCQFSIAISDSSGHEVYRMPVANLQSNQTFRLCTREPGLVPEYDLYDECYNCGDGDDSHSGFQRLDDPLGCSAVKGGQPQLDGLSAGTATIFLDPRCVPDDFADDDGHGFGIYSSSVELETEEYEDGSYGRRARAWRKGGVTFRNRGNRGD